MPWEQYVGAPYISPHIDVVTFMLGCDFKGTLTLAKPRMPRWLPPDKAVTAAEIPTPPEAMYAY